MPLKEHSEETVEVGKVIHTQDLGYVFKTVGDGTKTVKIPPHMAKFFKEHGLLQ